MPLPSFLQRIVDFLRAGYPEGVPEHDYIPLFALLSSRLSDDEVRMIADELAAGSGNDATSASIRRAVELVSAGPASAADIQRVRDRLASVGFTDEVVAGGTA